MSSVLYPLRASASWFEGPEAVEALRRHIKLNLFLYDSLNFQDGLYELQVTQGGAFEFTVPRDPKEAELRFGKGGTVNYSIAPQREGAHGEYVSLIQGEALSSYHVDFYPVLKDLGLISQDGINIWSGDLKEEAGKILEPYIKRDQRDSELLEALPVPPFERNYLLKALYRDAFLAAGLRMSVAFDSRVSTLLTIQQERRVPTVVPDAAPIAFERALLHQMPDVRNLSWDELIELRESAAGISFRRMIERARRRILDEIPNLRTENDVREIVVQVMMQDLINELQSQYSAVGSIAVGFAMNMIPVIGPAAYTGVSLIDALRSSQSWVALLKRDG